MMLLAFGLLCNLHLLQFFEKHGFESCHLSAVQVTLHVRNYCLNDVFFHCFLIYRVHYNIRITTINQNLEALAKQLYDYWFVQFDFPNEEGKPYKSSDGAMVWNEKLKRYIPEGWKVLPLFDAVSVQYGFPFTTEQFTEEI